MSLEKIAGATPPHAWFVVSAVFHYLGPSFAVLLFPAIGVLGVAWFRVVTAALVFAPLTRPRATLQRSTGIDLLLLAALGACLAAMNTAFYLALERLPMSLVAAMEFLATIAVALVGLRTMRNGCALALTATGVALLIDVRWASDPAGLLWSAANALLFALYIVLGHRIAERGAGDGVQRLGAAMAIAAVLLTPVGLAEATAAFGSIPLVLAGMGVGVCSSVIPYVADQFAMSRLPRASFALMLALLPASATIIAAVVLAQIPTMRDLAGIAFVMAGVAVHRPAPSADG
jgi:inner membrane transporter RhtA